MKNISFCQNPFGPIMPRFSGAFLHSSYGTVYEGAYFGQGTGSILLDDLKCYGYESDITQCMTKNWYSNDCSHGEDVGVDCHGNLKTYFVHNPELSI